MPELQASVFLGNLCYRHRTPFGVYKIITRGGGVVPEVAQIVVHSIVITDHAQTVSVGPAHRENNETSIP